MDEFLEWDFQIKHVLMKMSAGNYSLSMVKNFLPQNFKKLIYYANIQSHLSYGISAWGSMVKLKDIKKLQVQQNKAIRNMCNVGRRVRMSDYYKKLNLIKIEDLVKLNLLKIAHRYIYGTLPVRLGNLFNLSHHNYHTRTRNYLRAPQHTTEKYNTSFLGRSPHLWLYLEERLKEKDKLKNFIKHYCHHIIASY
jgi:hypothetical protein